MKIPISTFFLYALASAVAADPLLVNTSSGAVQGHYSIPTVREFLGIPYGTAQRWTKATLATASSTTIQATSYGASCWQDLGSISGALYTLVYAISSTPQDENCFSVNVWSPANATNLPVVFWTYGGAYQLGSSNTAQYNGTKFARDGVIFVSYNYRESIFGFPNAPQIAKEDANLGLYDTFLALQWVKQNIASFGGDPDKITVFGQSAGASSTASLLEYNWGESVPFWGGALLSGATQTLRRTFGNFSTWNSLATAVGCNQTAGSTDQFTCMQAVPAGTLMNQTGSSNLVFIPIDDDITRSTAPTALSLAGNVANVPILAGTMQDDGTLFSTGQLTFDDWIQDGGGSGMLYNFNPTLKGKLSVAAAHKAYPQYLLNQQDAIQAAFRDYGFLCPEQSVLKARKQAFPSTPIWRYSFGAIDQGLEHGLIYLKAFHASDIPFAFDTIDANIIAQLGSSPENLALQTFWHSVYVTFAKNPSGGPGWAAYSPTSNNLAYVGYAGKNATGLVVANNTFDANCDNFWAGGFS